MTDPLAVASDLTDFQAGDPDVLVAAAQGLVRTYCGWHIAPSQTDTVTLYRPIGSLLLLPTLHLTEVQSVTTYATVDADAVELTADTDYRWDEAGYIILTGCNLFVQHRVVVQFTHGYPTVPPELRAAVLSLAAASPFATGTATRVGQVSMEDGIDRMGSVHQQVLDRYRIPAAA